MNTNTPAVLADVADERKRQDEKWGGPEHDDQHDTAAFVQLIEDYAGWARTMAGMGSNHKARVRLIQVAALAVAAVESLDRWHVPDTHICSGCDEPVACGAEGCRNK